MLGMFSHTVYAQSNNNCEAKLIKVRKLVSLFINKQAIPKGALAQLTAIANACPYQEGPAVYEARAFLSGYTGNTVYANVCEVPVIEGVQERLSADIYGLNKITDNKTLAFYPNPAGKELNVVLSNSNTKVNYTIKNYLGQSVLTGVINSSNTQINVENLSKGIYVIEANVNGALQQYKFVKE